MRYRKPALSQTWKVFYRKLRIFIFPGGVSKKKILKKFLKMVLKFFFRNASRKKEKNPEKSRILFSRDPFQFFSIFFLIFLRKKFCTHLPEKYFSGRAPRLRNKESSVICFINVLTTTKNYNEISDSQFCSTGRRFTELQGSSLRDSSRSDSGTFGDSSLRDSGAFSDSPLSKVSLD